MPGIFETLKKAEEQRKAKEAGQAAQPPVDEPVVGAPAWEVKMVSHCRFTRTQVEGKSTGDLSRQNREVWEPVCPETGPGLSPPAGMMTKTGRLARRHIDVVLLVFLLLFAGSLSTYLWLQPEAVTTPPSVPTGSTAREVQNQLVQRETEPSRPDATTGSPGQTPAAAKPENVPAREAFKVLAEGSTTTFRGEIAERLRIEMTLVREGSRLSGSYWYERIGKDITLKGTIEDTGAVVLEEFVRGQKTGTFSGRVISGERIEGKWTKPGSSRERDFFLVSKGTLRSLPVEYDQEWMG